MAYNVQCRVSGGRTGTREKLLTQGDSAVPVAFDTFEEAQAKADSLTIKMNNEHSVAFFEYWPVEQR